MSMAPGGAAATAWTPDATTAANLGPASGYASPSVAGSAAVGAAAMPPFAHSNSSYAYRDPAERSPTAEQPLLAQTYTGSGGGHTGSMSGRETSNTTSALYTTNPSEGTPSSPYPAQFHPSNSGYSPPGSGVGPGSSVSQQGMAETDVDRIAARVASMMAMQGGSALPPGAAGPSHTTGGFMGDDDAPPMYHESGPARAAPAEKSGYNP